MCCVVLAPWMHDCIGAGKLVQVEAAAALDAPFGCVGEEEAGPLAVMAPASGTDRGEGSVQCSCCHHLPISDCH